MKKRNILLFPFMPLENHSILENSTLHEIQKQWIEDIITVLTPFKYKISANKGGEINHFYNTSTDIDDGLYITKLDGILTGMPFHFRWYCSSINYRIIIQTSKNRHRISWQYNFTSKNNIASLYFLIFKRKKIKFFLDEKVLSVHKKS
ncbi:hypothetical protein SAMN05421741_11347 [Paenimyroides ummariense]|uniref:Uncharacterized protein n=1 Tax=Paenimyroides ummariense TaxID=913024 RepID=A0A1I5CTQ4_9FLAO|nr:hypothetical protein SAMN05421741_11347 [Paenimyroides ummariense]